jgi:predicted nucleic acid-binding protein
MIILDTNVLSELIKPSPNPSVVAWLNAQSAGVVWTTAVSVFEIRFGIAILPAGKKRDQLEQAFQVVLAQDLSRRVLALDESAADEAAAFAARARAAGRPIDFRDTLIAGTVAARSGTLATRNIRHFQDAGIQLVDPWTAPVP